jgi:hypothetical protein
MTGKSLKRKLQLVLEKIKSFCYGFNMRLTYMLNNVLVGGHIGYYFNTVWEIALG